MLIVNKSSYKLYNKQILKLKKIRIGLSMAISKLTDDLKISSMKEMISPSDLIEQLRCQKSNRNCC